MTAAPPDWEAVERSASILKMRVVVQSNDQLPDMPARTVRHRFLRATGLTQSHIRQIERAQRAANLLRQGVSILDAVDTAGYFDQPHLTRALKQWVGHTPAQIVRMSQRACQSVQETQVAPDYDAGVLAAVM